MASPTVSPMNSRRYDANQFQPVPTWYGIGFFEPVPVLEYKDWYRFRRNPQRTRSRRNRGRDSVTDQPIAIRHRDGCSKPTAQDVYVVSVETGRGHVEQRCPSCSAVAKARPSWWVAPTTTTT